MIIVVIKSITYPNPKWLGIPKGAIVDPCYIEVLYNTGVPLGLQQGIYGAQACVELFLFCLLVEYSFPKRIIATAIY